ncbi:ribose-phosphate diphosphokinase [Neorhizobium sp. LjRoot104]|uniref:ribose-phosphate diphosphokinase n=1 Tax=Neorhizobium sp. LjRoot104 TaxID=3342254 RepID=UPI003ECC9CE9
MTMMAKPDKTLSRLFQRLDSAPSHMDERLSAVLQEWLDRRKQLIAPSPEAMLSPASSAADQAFIFQRDPSAPRRYLLTSGASSAEVLIGEVSMGGHLETARNRRGAVRLRRLFELVGETGEPILALFGTKSAEGKSFYVELLVAPLSKNGKYIDAFLSCVSARQVASAATKTVPHWIQPPPLLFAFDSSKHFGERVAAELGLPLCSIEERVFEDGEEKTRPLAHVRGREVYVVSGLERSGSLSVHDRLSKLLFFIATLKTNGAARVTAVVPYLAYMRKDRQTKEQDPLNSAYVARLFETVGTDCLITMETHNLAAFQNAFRCHTMHLTAYEAFAAFFANLPRSAEVSVVSPDLGGAKRADMFREVLEKALRQPIGKAFLEKQRSQGVVSGDLFAGDVKGRVVIILDDIISSGTTMARAARACAERGAAQIWLCATHGLFSKDAAANLAVPFIDGIVVTDTINIGQPYRCDKRLTIIPVAAVVAGTIAQCHGSAAG